MAIDRADFAEAVRVAPAAKKDKYLATAEKVSDRRAQANSWS